MRSKNGRSPLRQDLAALYAEAALRGEDVAPADDELRKVLERAAGTKLTPVKRALLLRSTLAGYDIAGAGQRMTPEEVRLARRERSDTTDAQTESAGLAVEHLDALTSETWRRLLLWLLEQQGYSIEHETARGSVLAFSCSQGDARVVVHAIRPIAGWVTTEDSVRQVAEAAAAERTAHAILVSLAPATVGASITARRAGVRLIDRAALRDLLATFETAAEREAASIRQEQDTRAEAAATARRALVAAVERTRTTLQGAKEPKRATGREVAKAATQLAEIGRTLRMAYIAWDTLLSEWASSFGERATRQGALSITASAEEFAAIAERGEHLGDVLAESATRLTGLPTARELGYGPWRQAVLEELVFRAEAYSARMHVVDPTAWSDFSRAFDERAMAESSRMLLDAEHAAARAAKASGDYARRAGTPGTAAGV